MRTWLVGGDGVGVSGRWKLLSSIFPWEPVEWNVDMCTVAQWGSCSMSELLESKISNLCCDQTLVICKFLKAEIRCQKSEVGSLPPALLTLLESRLH